MNGGNAAGERPKGKQTMSLLHRIAISNGDEQRRVLANRVMADMERELVSRWNCNLREEIYLRMHKRFIGDEQRRVLAKRVMADMERELMSRRQEKTSLKAGGGFNENRR
ncbi:MAG: hypothetical protein AB1801_07075 [Chloroflexota bacterium]